MSLAPGTRLGPYELIAPIGKGGMGEVYRAHDTRLARDVAIKVIARSLAANAITLARFEREAKAVAALSHPNILGIYDFSADGDTVFAAMELLDGENLRQRMNAAPGSPFPLRKALDYARQIVRGLAAAHQKGIAHRDLKPENIFITRDGSVKILDFGLAKAAVTTPEADGVLTVTDVTTFPGNVSGTVGYTSPEQLRGGGGDQRSDIFSFGLVFYEMLFGQRAFARGTPVETMTAILNDDPREPPLNRRVPSAIESILHRCLEKNPEERFHSAHDLGLALEAVTHRSDRDAGATSVAGQSRQWRRPRERLAWAIAAIGAIATIAMLAYSRSSALDSDAPVLSLTVPLPGQATTPSTVVLSPDGRRLAFAADTPEGKSLLWIRPLETPAAQPLAGTENGTWPFWSPDSRFLAFFTGSKLKKVDVASGSVETLCDAGDARGGSWSRDGVILFSPGYADGLYRVAAEGGPITAVTTLDSARTDTSHRWPQFLPDGLHFLYVIVSAQADRKGIYAGSLDSASATRLLPVVSMTTWAPPGFLLYARDDTLFAQRFDTKRLELVGDPISVTRRVWYKSGIGGFSAFSASQTGLLVYRRGGAATTKLVWFTRAGRRLESTGPPGLYSEPALSPDGKQVAVGRGEDQPGRAEIWVLDHRGTSGSRLTFQQSDQSAPLWSPDGKGIVFSTNQTGSYELRQKMASGGAAEEVLVRGDPATAQYADDWSPDGQFIVYDAVGPRGDVDLWLLPLAGDRKPRPFLRTRFRETQARFAPDGRWIAYSSDETGRHEIFVQTFPLSGGKWQVSDHGGAQPVWRRDGKALFYLSADRVLMEVEVRPGGMTFQTGAPKPLFPVHTGGLTVARNDYVVSPDGQEFLVNTLEESSETSIAIVLNWAGRLTQRTGWWK